MTRNKNTKHRRINRNRYMKGGKPTMKHFTDLNDFVKKILGKGGRGQKGRLVRINKYKKNFPELYRGEKKPEYVDKFINAVNSLIDDKGLVWVDSDTFLDFIIENKSNIISNIGTSEEASTEQSTEEDDGEHKFGGGGGKRRNRSKLRRKRRPTKMRFTRKSNRAKTRRKTKRRLKRHN